LTEEGDWWAVERNSDAAFVRRARGDELVGLEYEGPFDSLPAQQGVVHRVIPWDDVTLSEGTGIVHIAPGCGKEDFELSRVHDLPVLMPINESGMFYEAYGEFEGRSTEDVEKPVVVELERRGRLVEAGSIIHRYPVCWRCATPLVFRIADDWLISADEIRQPMLDANATVKWTPDFYSKRMDDWLRNMDDWNISRRRYFGLPLPFYPCNSCGRLTVIGSVAELRERATGGLDQLKELHRPWIDEVPIACECGAEVRRVQEVGDAWLDAGIVPFSTLGWQNPEWIEHGYATGAAAGLTGADLPDHAYWEKWYPADWVSEMREQIRLWFYSQSFMSVTLTGRSPYKSVLDLREVARRTRPGDASVLGQLDRRGRSPAEHRCGRHPVHVLRAGAESKPEVRLRPRGRDQAPAAHSVELRQVLRRLREHPRVRARRRGTVWAPATRPLAARAHRATRRRDDRGL